MRKRLLIITDEMEIGGTQRQIVELCRHIDRDSFDVAVVYFRNASAHVEELEQVGVHVTCIPKRWKVDPVFLLRLCRYLRRGEFDVIHGFSFGGELWGWLANLLAGNARFVSSARSVYEWYSPLQWSIKRWITLNSAALVANSHAGARCAALNMGIRQSSIQVVHNGMKITPALEDAMRNRRERAPDTFTVLFIGRLVGHKNLPCLLRAFRELAARVPGARLELVGDGPERAALQAQAVESGIADRVIFHGEVRDVETHLLRADAFVCSSHREGLCNAIMEAMSAGLPVVASNVGGNSELIAHEETGLLFPPDDHESLAAMLADLAGDPARCLELGRAAHAFVRRFHDPRRMAAEMERIYERCLLQDAACAVER